MNRSYVTVCVTAALIVVCTVALASRGGDELDLSWFTIDGGGAMLSTGGDLELSGTIGQPDAGVLAGGDLTLSGGFWFEQPPGDCNATGDVSLLDHEDFVACMTGPESPPLPPECMCFDVDRDGDTDVMDFALLQAFFTGL